MPQPFYIQFSEKNIAHEMYDALTQEQKYLRLANQLHSSLDLNKIMQQMIEGILQEVKIEHFEYHHQTYEIHIIWKKLKAASFSQQLLLDTEDLGQIILSREEPFEKKELLKFKHLFGLLWYPLKNGLQYYQAIQSSLHDPLTGLLNRGALQQILHKEIESAKRHLQTLSVLLLDVDHFKMINDQYGHIAGDEILKILGKQLSSWIRKSDNIFRIGGEEFLILMNNTPLKGAKRLAERICRAVDKMDCSLDKQNVENIHITISIGVAEFHSSDTEMSLLERADQSLYTAKQLGRNQIFSNPNF